MKHIIEAAALILLMIACSTPSERAPSDTGDGAPDIIYPDGWDADDVEPIDDAEPLPDVDNAPDDIVVDETQVQDDVPPPPDTDDPGPGELPPPNGVAKFSNCSEPEGGRNIYDLQDPQCPDHITPEPTESPGVPVLLEGVIVTAVFGDTTFVQEAAGGPYSGVAIFTHGESDPQITVGAIVDIDGSYSEYFGLTQIYLNSWTKVGDAGDVQPFKVSHPAHVATGGAMAEMFEGVLIRVDAVQTIHTKPDCPQEYGEFLVTGDLRVDDMGSHTWDARLGDQFASITGPLTFTFENFKIEPRDDADLDSTKKGGASSTSKCIESDCIVPETATGTHQVVVNEIMADPYGNDTGQEWIELHNPTDEAVSVDGWEIRDCGAQKYPLIGADLVIEAGGYLVVGANKNPVTNGGVPVDVAYGDGFYLPNSVGAVILFDGVNAQAQVVDQARYSRFEPWDVFLTGKSLERLGPETDGSKPQAWATGSKTYGVGENQGTPGAANSQ